nr:hypothetical protein [Micromonospora sp. DSM 115978]
MTGQRPIPGLVDTLMYAHCVQVWFSHAPVGGLCACGWPRCRRREAAEWVIVAAGVDPATLAATSAQPATLTAPAVRPASLAATAGQPGPWYERPAPPPARGIVAASVAAHPIPRGERRRPPSNAGNRW